MSSSQPVTPASSSGSSEPASPSPHQSVSQSVSPASSPTGSPSAPRGHGFSIGPIRVSAHKKDKKNVREKRRRGELNRKFDLLRELLQMSEGKSKVEKSQILTEAINAIHKLKTANQELTQILNQQQLQQQLQQQQQQQQQTHPSNPMNLQSFIGVLPQAALMTSNISSASSQFDAQAQAAATNNNLLVQLAQLTRNQQQSQAPPHPNPASFIQHPQLAMSQANPQLVGRAASAMAMSSSPTPLTFTTAHAQAVAAFAANQQSNNAAAFSLPAQLTMNPQLAAAYAQQMQHLQQMQQLQQQHQPGITTGATVSLISSIPQTHHTNTNNAAMTPMLPVTASPQTVTRASSYSSLQSIDNVAMKVEQQQNHRQCH